MVTSMIRVHAVMGRSVANGPGTRSVVWVQGCTLGCQGCFNPETHPDEGEPRSVASLVTELMALNPETDGLTVTGGEPLQQARAVSDLLAEWRTRSQTSVVVLTGFTWEEVMSDPDRRAAVAHADVVVAGRYNRRQHVGSGLRGSGNKAYHFLTDVYAAEDFDEVPDLEIEIAADGTMTVTGMVGAAPLLEHGAQPDTGPL